MTSILKGAIGIGGVGVSVGGGFLLNSFISKDKPKSFLIRKLEEDKFTILNLDTSKAEEASSGWKKILTSYASLTKTKQELKMGNLSLEADDKDGINKLKKACSSILKVEKDSSEFQKNYNLASKWCAEPISIRDLLSKRGTPYLNNNNSEGWTAIAKNYETYKKTKNKDPLAGVDWTEVSGTDYSGNINKIQTACNTRISKSSHEDEFETSLEEAKQWCTENPTG